MSFDPAISAAFALSLALLFGASAAHKLSGFDRFAGVVRNYRLLPDQTAPLVVALIAAAETAIAILLLVPQWRAIGAIGAALLLAGYAGVIAYNIARGRADIDCGCSFGPSADRLTPSLVVRNAALIAAAIAILAPTSGRSLGVVDFVFILLFATTAAVFYVGFDAVRSNAVRFGYAGGAR